MAKKINLFKTKPGRPLSSTFLFISKEGKKLGVLLSIIFFSGFLFVNFLIIQKNTEIKQLNFEKENYLNYLLANKNNEAKFRYFKAKQKQLTDYYGEDASFLPYYQVLSSALKPASESALIESVTINSKRDSTFIVKILDYDKAINFLRYVESDEFLSNFDELTLTSFNLFQNSKNKLESNIGYQFSFKGSFKQINVTL